MTAISCPATVSVTTPPSDGATSVDPGTGAITYTPNAGFFGQDRFEYSVTDDGAPLPGKTATATVTIFTDQLIVVNTLLDETLDKLQSGAMTLRLAIEQVGAGGTIAFAPDLVGAIHLNPLLGELVVERDMTIEGPGAAIVTVDADTFARVFRIDDGDTGSSAQVAISRLAITNGDPGDGTAGGAIRNAEHLTLSGCAVSNSSASTGGGIFNTGALVIHRSVLFFNAAIEGGGIWNEGSLIMTNTTVSGNSAAGAGSGIYHGSFEPAVLVNCTVAGNLANDDGISNGEGAALFVEDGAAPMDVRNSIVLGNSDTPDNAGAGTPHPDVAGDFIGGQTNSIGVVDGATGFGGSDTILGAGQADVVIDLVLRQNGGGIPTHALVPGSAAIDAGDNGHVSATIMAGPPMTDGRGPGYPRVAGGTVDIGAFEQRVFCDEPTHLDDRLENLRQEFAIESEDFDGDLVPELFTLALVVEMNCTSDQGPLAEATRNAFLINLTTLEGEHDFAQVAEHREIIALLLVISQDTQAALRDILSASGISLTLEYEVVTCDDETGACMPGALAKESVAEGYEVFDGLAKTLYEPYAGSGDLGR